MTEVFKVFNAKNSSMSFNLTSQLDVDKLWALSEHRRRRVLRGSNIPVLVSAKTSVDLVKTTGLSIKEIKASPEFNQILAKKGLQVLVDSSKPVEDIKEEVIEAVNEMIKEPIKEVVAEDLKIPTNPHAGQTLADLNEEPVESIDPGPYSTEEFLMGEEPKEGQQVAEEAPVEEPVNPIISTTPVMPTMPTMPKQPVEKPVEKPKRKGGRAKGTPNKPKVKNKGGRPKGTPNKPKVKKEL